MYGLLLDSIQKFLLEKYGDRYWASIRRRAKLKNHWFVTHEVYSDSLMHDLVEAAAVELGEDRDTVMMMFGEYFAHTIGRYGYARLLRVLGRDLRDFLNGLDDLHEYLRFSYPKMRPPSFLCENETPEGMLLHYTSQREGYLSYVIGQLQTMGKIYGKQLEVSVVREDEKKGEETHVVFDLKFDNSAILRQHTANIDGTELQISAETFLGIFPFCVVFEKDLTISRVGTKLQEVLPSLIGCRLDRAFTVCKPHHATLEWKTIHMHTNCTFELLSERRVCRFIQPGLDRSSPGMEFSSHPPTLKLKGQMLPMPSIESIAFLCSPSMDSPEDLYESGIFISDLSMHDSSRDFILAGSQQNPELNLALSQEKIRSAQLEESIQRTDHLLYQMIPKPIADQLRSGETPLNTCQEFAAVSILFSDIVSFTPMCSRLRPMEVVCVLNAMYVAYDRLCEKHHVYKVETIGDAYMVISGAPLETEHHAEYITDFACSIVKATSKINDPSTSQSLRVRIGIHSGPVVAGVVGASILRYDVFGDTVNVAARMEATGEPMRIHVSESTAELLQTTNFDIKKRGRVEVKGKGFMNTFWVTDRKDSSNEPMLNPFQRLRQSSKPAIFSPPVMPGPPVSPHLLAVPSRLPKADNWPQAERSLHRDAQQRTSTLPSLEADVLDVLPHSRTTRHALTNDILPSLHLAARRASTDVRIVRSNSVSSTIQVEELDFNILRLRESISDAPPPIISEPSLSHMAAFTAAAEENARQGRRLATWAAELTRAAATRESSVDAEYLNYKPSSLSTSSSKPIEEDSHSQNGCQIV